MKRNNENNIICILAVHVDDILLIGKENKINQIKKRNIKDNFTINDVGEVDFVIGIIF